jgi:hypothetical protein
MIQPDDRFSDLSVDLSDLLTWVRAHFQGTPIHAQKAVPQGWSGF